MGDWSDRIAVTGGGATVTVRLRDDSDEHQKLKGLVTKLNNTSMGGHAGLL